MSWFKKTLQDVVPHLPKVLQQNFQFKFLNLNYQMPEAVEFRICDSKEDFESVFRLIAEKSELRTLGDHGTPVAKQEMAVTAFDAFPSTFHMIVKVAGRVRGVAILHLDSPRGLPIEETLSVQSLREPYRRIAELSEIIMDEEHVVLKPFLISYVARLCKAFKVDRLFFLATTQEVDDLELLVPFARLQKKKKGYTGHCLIHFNLDTVFSHLENTFSKMEMEKSLYHFLIQHPFNEFIFPQENLKIQKYKFSPNLLRYFFFEKSNVLVKLSDKMRESFCEYYDHPIYANIIGISACASKPSGPIAPRFEVTAAAKFLTSIEGVSFLFPVKIVDISAGGCKAAVEAELMIHHPGVLLVEPPGMPIIKVKAEPVWHAEERYYGFRLLEPSLVWTDFVEQVKSDQVRRSKSRTA